MKTANQVIKAGIALIADLPHLPQIRTILNGINYLSPKYSLITLETERRHCALVTMPVCYIRSVKELTDFKQQKHMVLLLREAFIFSQLPEEKRGEFLTKTLQLGIAQKWVMIFHLNRPEPESKLSRLLKQEGLMGKIRRRVK